MKFSGSLIDGMSSLFFGSVGSESIGADKTKVTASNKQHNICKKKMKIVRTKKLVHFLQNRLSIFSPYYKFYKIVF